MLDMDTMKWEDNTQRWKWSGPALYRATHRKGGVVHTHVARMPWPKEIAARAQEVWIVRMYIEAVCWRQQWPREDGVEVWIETQRPEGGWRVVHFELIDMEGGDNEPEE
jgi:hypothetical protein